MKKAILLSFMIFSSTAFALNQIDPNNFEAILKKAYTGDYQSMRNIAYGYAAWPYKNQDKNPILGCAWYRAIIHSGNLKVNETDIGNAQVYCNKLDQESQDAAKAQEITINNKLKHH